MITLGQGLKEITAAILRRKGRFALGPTGTVPETYGLALGSSGVVKANGGFVVTLGMTRAHLEELRALCDEALREMGDET